MWVRCARSFLGFPPTSSRTSTRRGSAPRSSSSAPLSSSQPQNGRSSPCSSTSVPLIVSVPSSRRRVTRAVAAASRARVTSSPLESRDAAARREWVGNHGSPSDGAVVSARRASWLRDRGRKSNGWIRLLVKFSAQLLPVVRDVVACGPRVAEPTEGVPCDHVLLVMSGRRSQARGRVISRSGLRVDSPKDVASGCLRVRSMERGAHGRLLRPRAAPGMPARRRRRVCRRIDAAPRDSWGRGQRSIRASGPALACGRPPAV